MACRLYLAQVATGSSQNLSGATDVFLLMHRGHRLRVTPYNFTSNHHTFTVSAISDNLFFGPQVELCNKAPVVDLKSGQPTAFASSAGDAAKIALGNDGANQPGSADCSFMNVQL
uniref:Uncharacterized protein n=1 Tax=Brassica oleracea var. oleracea TaxID=109376 RepID=A0A0D2ZS67_BRAOL